MIRIPQLKLNIHHTEADLRQAVKKELRLAHDNFTYTIKNVLSMQEKSRNFILCMRLMSLFLKKKNSGF